MKLFWRSVQNIQCANKFFLLFYSSHFFFECESESKPSIAEKRVGERKHIELNRGFMCRFVCLLWPVFLGSVVAGRRECVSIEVCKYGDLAVQSCCFGFILLCTPSVVRITQNPNDRISYTK